MVYLSTLLVSIYVLHIVALLGRGLIGLSIYLFVSSVLAIIASFAALYCVRRLPMRFRREMLIATTIIFLLFVRSITSWAVEFTHWYASDPADIAIFFGGVISAIIITQMDAAVLSKFFRKLTIISLTMGLLILLTLDFNQIAEGVRGTRISEASVLKSYFAHTWLSLTLASIVSMSPLFFDRGWLSKSILTLILFLLVIISVYNWKRADLVNLVVAYAVPFSVLFFNIRWKVSGFPRAKAVGALFGVALFSYALSYFSYTAPIFNSFDAVISRFAQIDSFLQINRIIELRSVVSQFGVLDFLVGAGMSRHFYSPALGYETQSLHVGWGQILYIGGIPLLLAVAFYIMRNIWWGIRIKEPKVKAGLLGSAIFLAIALSHSTIIGTYIGSFIAALLIAAPYRFAMSHIDEVKLQRAHYAKKR